MDEIYEMCRKRALQWDHQYTNKAHESSPSEYLVWRGRALEAAYLAEVIKNLPVESSEYEREKVAQCMMSKVVM